MKNSNQLDIHSKWFITEWDLVAKGEATIYFNDDIKKNVVNNRNSLEKRIKNGDVLYGVNTGFGSLCTTIVTNSELRDLQVNLIRSHAAGTGSSVSQEIVRLMLVTKIRALSKGYSGIRWVVIESLYNLYKNDILPVIPSMGSLGASGDLAPLSHMVLVLMGEGEAMYENKIYSGSEILQKLNLEPLKLMEKEGLALINGTQFMLAHGLWASIRAMHVSYWSDLISSVSMIGFDASSAPFDSRIQTIRNQPGQIFVAERIRDLLNDAPSFQIEKEHVQDPYSFRCIPQVHGASNDAWHHILNVFLNEADAVTDNPTVFTDEGDVISAGNFHGQKLALALDYGKMALAEWGSISERRINQLTLGKRGLPSFLAQKPGVESGIMILQYSAASLVSRNKQRTVPSSTDSIDSSAGQEDHVSMGANAATDAIKILDRVWTILSMEWIAAVRAVELSKRECPEGLTDLLVSYRSIYPRVNGDNIMAEEIKVAEKFLKDIIVNTSALSFSK